MTEKRFTIPTNCRIKDNKKGTIHNITNDFDTNHLCKLLNELNDENQRLLSANTKLTNENTAILNLIRTTYQNERTNIGRNVLKQLIDNLE